MKTNLKGHFKLKLINSRLISKLFKTSEKEIKKYCGKTLSFYNLNYREISSDEYKKAIIEIIKKVENDRQNVLSKTRKKIWTSGWSENLSEYKKTNSFLSLIPKYYINRPNKIFRLGAQLVKSNQKYFEWRMLEIYRLWFYKKFFKDIQNIYEFGVGSASNLNHLFKIFPEKNLYGLDFVKPSVDLVNLIAKRSQNKKLKGILFDMLKPNMNIKINNDAAFFSIGAFEQLGNKIDKILNFWIKKKPKICLNIEPDKYFYNLDLPEDYLALKFHTQRNYTSTLYDKLKKLEKKRKIKILKKFRAPFGNYVFDAYNFFLWRVI